MGVKGLQITIAVSLAATVILLVGLSLEFQRIAFSIYSVPSARILVHLRHAEFEAFVVKIIQELFHHQEDQDKFQDFAKTRVHDLQDVKDVLCGLNGGFIHGEIVALCDQFTADYYGGLTVMTISIIAIVLELVGCGYLAYYLSGRTKKGYRRMARILFVFAPVAEMTALMMYCVVIAVTSRDGGGILRVTITWTPGSGLMLCCIACTAFFVIAFLHKQWKLEQIEFLNEQRLERKHKVEEKLMGQLYGPEPQPPSPFSYNGAFPQSASPSTSAPVGDIFPYSAAAPRYTGNYEKYSPNAYDQQHRSTAIAEVPLQYNQHLIPSVVEIVSLGPYDHSHCPSYVVGTR